MKKEFKLELTLKQKLFIMIPATVIYGLVLYLLGSDESLKTIAFQAIIWGVLFTLFLVFLFPWIMKKLLGKRIDNIKPELFEHELIEDAIFASLFKGFEGVGGKIFLTNTRLVFKSHSLNIQAGQTNINYTEIAEVRERKTMKVINNGVNLITKDGKEYHFVVNDRDAQIQKIKNKVT